VTDYSIWVIEFARASSPPGLLLHGQAGDREIPYCFTVLRSDRHTILFDAGYRHAGRGRELADLDGITIWRDPAELLARCGAGPAEDVFPGISLVPDFDTHTYGHQHVVIRNQSSGVWVVPRRRRVPVREHRGHRRRRPLRSHRPGHGQPGEVPAGPRRADAGDRRPDQPHPARARKQLWDRHPSRQFGDGLHLAEPCLRPGKPSRLTGDGGGGAPGAGGGAAR
jgi:hypothetical protein